MVLQELGSQITGALSKLSKADMIDDELLTAVLKEISMALIHSDVNIRIVNQLRNNVKSKCTPEQLESGANVRKLIQKAVFEELVNMLSASSEPYVPKKGRTNVFMFVGLQGAGKTTTVAKFAYHYARRGWKTAMVCCDTFRAGAFDQLKQNATRIHVPFYGSYVEADPVQIAVDGLKQFRDEGYEIVLVDTSGRHRQEAALFDEMEQVEEAVDPDEVIFVMDSSIGSAVGDQAAAFKEAVPVGSVIITKLDGHAKGGGALSAVAATDSPVTFIGTGEQFDEFEKFEAKSFVSRLLGMGDLKGLMESVKEKTDLFEKAPEMMQRIASKGEFTLRDMREQLNSVIQLGSASQLMAMIPGMSNMMPGATPSKDQEQELAKRFQKFLAIMDSMTTDELDGIYKERKKNKDGKGCTYHIEKSMNESRMERIAKGSGTSMAEVHMLLQMHKNMANTMQKLGKSGMMKNEQNFAQGMSRNPTQMMQNMQKSIDPKMMAQLGGAQNMMNMMKEMGNMEGLSEMMKGMGGGGGGATGGGGSGGGRGTKPRKR